jgi:WD40 repeat protein
LTSYCTITSHDAVNAVVGYPFFDLGNPSTALVLSSRKNLPIRLNSALTGGLAASYSLVNPMTEAYICPNSLIFNPEGDRFIAGSDSLLSIFDLSRPGQEPTSSFPTGPRRRNDSHYNPAINMRGIVSALAIDTPSRVLAAGTYSRHVGLYDSMGEGECIGVFCIKGTTADAQIGGAGITEVSWSPCGRYLYITERMSDGVIVYDIRKTGQLLAWLQGRGAKTNQRMSVDIVSADGTDNHEVWGGGLDGYVRMWKNPHQQEGSVLPTFEFKAHEGRELDFVLSELG